MYKVNYFSLEKKKRRRKINYFSIEKENEDIKSITFHSKKKKTKT